MKPHDLAFAVGILIPWLILMVALALRGFAMQGGAIAEAVPADDDKPRPRLYTNEEVLQMLKDAADKLEATNASLKASTDRLGARVRAMEKRLEGQR